MIDGWTRTQAEHVYRRYAGLVRYRAMNILGDEQDAREVTQEAFARLFRHYRAEDADETPAALLIRITTNLSLTLIRDHSSRREKLKMRAGEAPGLGSGPLGQETIERAELVRSLLDRVPHDVRQLAVNYYIDGMTQQEIAELHHISVPTVRKRLDQFVRRSRKALSRELARALGAVLVAAQWFAA